MTVSASESKGRTEYLSLIAAIGCVAMLIFFADEVSRAFTDGVRLAVCSVLPSLFPFMIIADYISSTGMRGGGVFAKGFEKLFRIPAAGFGIFLTGILCGFPIGVRGTARAYEDGVISRDECERLSAISNNPSPAFVISGVGLMLGSIRLGVMLYLCVIGAAIILGILFRGKRRVFELSDYNSRQNFDIVSSIKSAGVSSVVISSYIIFFSIVLAIINKAVSFELITGLIACLLEVGNASRAIASASFGTPSLRLGLIAFALGFSGLSVHMQSFSFLPDGISRKRIIVLKLIQGGLAFILAFLASILMQK